MKEAEKAREILNIAIKTAINRKHQKVISILLTVDTASSYMGPVIKMYFERFAKDTIAEDANFIITEIKAKLRCPRCEKEFTRKPDDHSCPVCFTQGVPCKVKTEMRIEKIETE